MLLIHKVERILKETLRNHPWRLKTGATTFEIGTGPTKFAKFRKLFFEQFAYSVVHIR